MLTDLLAIIGGLCGILSIIITLWHRWLDIQTKPKLELKNQLIDAPNKSILMSSLVVNNMGRIKWRLNRALFVVEYFQTFDNLFSFFDDSNHLIELFDRECTKIDVHQPETIQNTNLETKDVEWLQGQNILMLLNLPRFYREHQSIRFNENLTNQIYYEAEEAGFYRTTLLVEWGKKRKYTTFQSFITYIDPKK